MRDHRSTPRGSFVFLGVAAVMLGACGGNSTQPYEGASLVTAPGTDPGSISFEARWSGQLTLSDGCLVLSQGDTFFVIPPSGSQLVGSDPDELKLRVGDVDAQLGEDSSGGGAYMDIDDARLAQFPGASDCISRTNASGVLLLGSIAS